MNVERVAHVSIGDELLAGRHADLDAPRVAEALAERGLSLGEVRVLSDDEGRIVDALRDLSSEHALIVTSGGLGPTLDDVTRHAVAAAFDAPLEERPAALESIRAYFEAGGRSMPPSNRRQALIPCGATIVENRHGTAPGFWLPGGAGRPRAGLLALPGPPRELSGMLADGALDAPLDALGQLVPTARRELTLFGLSESDFAEQVGDRMARGADPRMGVTARDGLLVVSIRSSGEGCATRVASLAAECEQSLSPWFVGWGEISLDALLARRLLEAGLTLATAESCTGGRVAAAMTRHAGISSVFLEGFVTYSNAAKMRSLGVPGALIELHGAVSAQTAAAMARGAARATGARLALSITGVAGPGGGSADKPVGLVWFGVAFDGAAWVVERRFPPSSRGRVQRRAEQTALFLGLAALDGQLGAAGAVAAPEG